MINQIFSYWREIIIAIIVSYGLTALIRNFALKYKLLPSVRSRDTHTKPTPRVGGVAIFVAFWLIVAGFLLVDPSRLQFSSSKVLGVDSNLFGVFCGGLIIFITGLLDDIKGLSWSTKLVAQVIAGTIVAFFGINIWWFSNPFGQLIVLGSWSLVFVVFWLVLLMNSVNLLDGLDGLASGVSAIAAIILASVALLGYVNQPSTALLALILFGVLIGFLPWNFNPAKIFLGDSGSLFLGYIIAVLAVISGGKVATAALVLGLPILDLIWVFVRRIKEKHSPFLPDKKHLHHRLIKAGFTVRQSVLFMYAISLVFGITALNSQTGEKFRAAGLLIGFMFLLGFYLVYRQKIYGTD